MERLTNKREADAQRKEYKNRISNGYPRNIPEERFLSLAAYEDTGLTPEQVEELAHDTTGPLHRKIGEWIEAEAAGRLVVLPCKVRSTVYTLFGNEIDEKTVGKFQINGYTNPKLWVELDCDWATTQIMRWDLVAGKTVFLTREEAEAALKGEENERG